MKTPEKSLYDYFFALSNSWGYHTYDYLPAKDQTVAYPFVIVGDTQTVPYSTKNSRNDHVFLTLDVWGQKEQLKAVSELADRFLNCALGQIKTNEYVFYGHSPQQAKQMMKDTSVVNTVFQRGHIEIEMEVIQWLKH